jgi:carboxyl-terminal processing protease
VKSVRTKVLDKNYGYIRISQFQTHSGEDLVEAIAQLKKDTNNNLKGIILDLRNNPGGILESSVKVSDAFLDKPKLGYNGMIVYTEGRLPGSEIKELAHEGDILNGAPIITLVNSGSASASEIVAGALQDHKRSLIVGTQTFGKGSVQTVLPLKDNHGLKLTTALYFTPSGRSIQAKGIEPDIEIPDIKIPEPKQDENENWINIREVDLEGHVDKPNKTDKKADKNIDKKTDKTSETDKDKTLTDDNKPLVNQDYQLNEALNLLKGLVLTTPVLPNKAVLTTKNQKAKLILQETQSE